CGPWETSPVSLSIPSWQAAQAVFPACEAWENLISSFWRPKSAHRGSPVSSRNHATFFSSGLSFSLSISSWQFMQKALDGIPAFASFSAPSWQSTHEMPRTVCASWLKGRGGGAAGGKIAWKRLQDETTTASPATRQTVTIANPGWRQEIQRTRGLEGMSESEFKDTECPDRIVLQ